VTYRPWTALELRRAAAWRAQGLTWKQVAAGLPGRTWTAVSEQLRYRRLVPRRDDAGRRRRVAQLHRAGHHPQEIARRLGVYSNVVRYHLRALGLTPHRADRRAAYRAGMGRYRHEHGTTPHAVRTERERLANAVNEGWPAVTDRTARYLDLLHRRGPMTPAAVAAALGYKQQAGVDRLRSLAAAGLVARVRPYSRRHRRAAVYDLTADVRGGRDRLLAYRSEAFPARGRG
jgi:predicted ArsR family transcriptional regulator